jgi:ribosome-binding factor A
MTKSQRQLQIGETVKRAISEIFLRSEALAIPGSYITILEADVSPDAKNAKIYIDIFGNEQNHQKIIKDLNASAPAIRHEMLKLVYLRSAPQIRFILDNTASKASNIENLIAEESKKFSKNEQD